LILFTSESTEDSLRSKMRLFLSFQISQETKRVIEHDPLREVPIIEVTVTHHSLVEVLGVHRVGRKSSRPSHVAT
jgi:hypothetical protein